MGSTKRILHVSTFYPPHTGGIEDVCRSVVSFLKTQPNVEQRVFCFNDTSKSVREGDITRVGRIAKVASQSIAPSFLNMLRREIREFRPDFVHFHAPNPLAAACLLMVLPKGVKLIVHWHSDIIEQRMIYRLIKPVETALLRRADVIVATSEPYVEGSRPLKPFREKCVVIPNVVDTSKFDVAARPLVKEKPMVLYVGRHVKYKGIDHLLRAASMVKGDCHIVIAGSGPETERLRRDFPLDNVSFVGRISGDELARYYRAADVFAFPSVTKNEAFGIALAEAMYCGTPAVTFTIEGSGVNWVNVDGVTGIEVENANAKELAEAIDRLLEDKALREGYGLSARRRVEELMTIERISGALKNLYE